MQFYHKSVTGAGFQWEIPKHPGIKNVPEEMFRPSAVVFRVFTLNLPRHWARRIFIAVQE
jgi:hypothetical protein